MSNTLKIVFISCGCLWVLAFVLWNIKARNWKGVFACVMAIIAGVIASFDKILWFNGDILALVFALIAGGLFFIGKKIIKSRKKPQ